MKRRMKTTVIIPTYRRPASLKDCLNGFKKQLRLADEILVVVRETDNLTWEFLEKFDAESLPLKILTVKATGVVAAMNLGLDTAGGDIVNFIDDDAVPHNDWLAKIEAHFLADPELAGVGGRDRLYKGKQLVKGEQHVVGKLQWFGRMIANHEIGVGAAREVDFLKGVNMSYRRAFIKDMHFDNRMKGTGAQVHFEVAFCLPLKRAGLKLIYDPQIVVDHYWAERFDEDIRDEFNLVAFFNEVHNETLAILEYFSSRHRRIIFIIWAMLVGTRRSFGLVQLIRFLPKEGRLAFNKWLVSIKGRKQGWLSWQQSKR